MADCTDDLLEQAADWHLRLSEEPASQADFQRWLHSSPEHLRAWQQIERVWGGIAQLAPAPVEPIVPKPLNRPRRRRYGLSAALAAGLAALAVLFYPQASLHWQADYLTGAGETRTLTLDDGSRVTLGPRSALKADYQPQRRDLHLLAGQAYFDVTHDSQRPFVVQADNTQVRVLGTAFEVELSERYLDVAVERGKVRVSSEHDGSSSEEDLLPGQGLRQNRLNGSLEQLNRGPEQLAAWRRGLLLVENRSVGDILEQMGRYTPGWIVLADSQLTERRINGVYDMRDPDRALGALAQSLSVPSQRITPWMRVLGSP